MDTNVYFSLTIIIIFVGWLIYMNKDLLLFIIERDLESCMKNSECNKKIPKKVNR